MYRNTIYTGCPARPLGWPQPGGTADAARIAVQRRQQPGDDTVGLGEDVASPQLRHARVDRLHLRQAAAQHDDVRVDEIDDVGQRPRQPVAIELERLRRFRIAGFRGVGDLGGAQIAARAPGELVLQRWPTEPGLDASLAAAIALRPWPLIVARQGQRVVAPFAADRLST